MSWPFGVEECPRCRYFQALEPPLHDDVGYEIVGLCSHPRIATELFRTETRETVGGCPCFTPLRPGAQAGTSRSPA